MLARDPTNRSSAVRCASMARQTGQFGALPASVPGPFIRSSYHAGLTGRIHSVHLPCRASRAPEAGGRRRG